MVGVGHGRTFWYIGREPRRALVSSDRFVLRVITLTLVAAFQYPYVLAFEPTFVEIRNVETGSMSQVIQGNNLRCLYTDTPPSLQQAYPTRMSRSSLSSSYNSHSHSSFPAYGQQQQQPPFGVYPGQPPVYPAQQLQQQSPQLGRGIGGREEIILVSDDRVLTLRMTLPGQ